MTVHKTFTRIAQRRHSMFGGLLDWEWRGDCYICNSGLDQQFNIPEHCNELQVDIIVADHRPDPEAHRVFDVSGGADDPALLIESPDTDGARTSYGLHTSFYRHLMQGKRLAEKQNSKIWMLCYTDTKT